MMSAAQSPTSLESRLKSLQCHFTWDLDLSRPKLLRLRDILEDIGTEEGNIWLGHIYNLQGYVHYKLGSSERAQDFFGKAAEAFRQIRNTDSDEGPWLVVNYGNMAWLHHLLGEEADSQAYLSKVDALLDEYPSPSQDELHPEVYAEKAWTLMKFSTEHKLQAAECFQRAIRMQPERVEWNTSYFIGLVNAAKHSTTGLEDEVLENMRIAMEQDPENLYLAIQYLVQRAKRGEQIQDEARELASQVSRNPVSSYSGIKALLRVYRQHHSIDEAIDLAEEAVESHPDVRYLKRCLALCYKWKIMFFSNNRPGQNMVNKAIDLHKEVIALYPDSSFVKKIDLANMYAKSSHSQARAEQMFQELLQSDLEQSEQQLLYNCYAKYLNFDRQDRNRSIDYHMMAAEIPLQCFHRENSIKVLRGIADRGRSRRCREIEQFLANLQEP